MMKPTRQQMLWAAGAVALALLAWLALREPVQMASVARVARGPLEQSFVEEGKTRLKQRYLVTAPVAGLVRRIALRPGDAVRAGQPVAEIDPSSSALLDPRARSQAQADVGTGGSALRAARQRVSAAISAEAVAQTEWRRAQELRAAGAVTQAQLDSARARAATAQAELATARADEQITAQRLAAAQASLAEEGRAGQGKVLRVLAPVDGVVLRRTIESATPVPVGQVLLELGDPAALEIEVEVLSTDAVRLAPGLKARVQRWGGEGVLEAVVARVEPGGFTKVSALGVEEQRTRVILDFASPREKWAALGDAFRVEVEFIVQQAQDMLLVPGSALFRSGEGWAVYRLDGSRARRTPVRIGARSATAAQVLEGLQADQRVIVQPDDRIREGTRIRAMEGR